MNDISALRHSCSHIMAQAVKELFPDAKLAIGPAIEDGFYYDFDVANPFSPDDLKRIEERMSQLIKEDAAFIREEWDKEKAREFFKKTGQTYKVELIDELPDNKVSIYRHSNFVDLCKGPHIESTGKVNAFKLLSSCGAYWRGDEHNKQLQRIYGTAFQTQTELEEYLTKLGELKKRDHRKLGKELGLFNVDDEIGPGLIIWHPNGAIIRKVIEDFWKKVHITEGYSLVATPHIARLDLWKRSGHLEFYRDYMYSPINIEGQEYILKPMNCPGHILIYKSQLHSYRELPVRLAELGTVYRYEKSGVLHGTLRVRGFTQDDAHIFCSPDQLEEEVINVIKLANSILSKFGFTQYKAYLSTMPPHHQGSIDDWQQAERSLRSALNKTMTGGFLVDAGEGVFYGPKIDIKVEDSLGREWQCSTIQVDFNLPQRFGISFVGEDGKDYTPIMIHRAILGSLERFFGVLIEHYSGAFPAWLAPIQVAVIPIAQGHNIYAERVCSTLKEEDIRAEAYLQNQTMQYKIREAQTRKIPYMLIVGSKEAKTDTVSIRTRAKGDEGNAKIEEFIKRIKQECNTH